MFDRAEIEGVVREVIQEIFCQQATPKSSPIGSLQPKNKSNEALIATPYCDSIDVTDEELVDICSQEVRQRVLIANPVDAEMMDRLRQMTTARIGAGRAGSRLNTVTMLTLRANHATARDSVFQEVDEG